MKNIIIAVAAIGLFFVLSWFYIDGDLEKINRDIFALDQKIVRVETNKGNFEFSLEAKRSPKTVENFVRHVNSDFYTDTIFHRTIAGVIIQGGGLSSEMKEKQSNHMVVNESNSGLSNLRGTVAMARRSNPNSATSQFFINLKDNKKLDYTDKQWGYAVFGKVTKGLDLLIELSKQKQIVSGIHKNVPKDEIRILSVKLVKEDYLEKAPSNPQRNTLDKLESENVSKNKSQPIKFEEGIHYQKLASPLSLTGSNKTEVISAFSYGCGHCYGAYAQVEAWKKSHLKEVDFSYFHAVWNPAMKLYAKTYYTAIELKIQKQIHVPLFEAIVINQETLSNKDEIASFFVKFGIEKNKFISTFESEKIEKRVNQAEKLTKKFQLASVPEFIVAGKYRVDPMRAGGQNKMFELLDFLLNKEVNEFN